ncbi:long-chain fatty acid--CoA ligase [Lysinibacillus yapensis]|uniref:Long-chain fatty acid--CoA ligase n=1 Tax=Ureibacillus yapensis TaxID=2304605 RepID=A0A396S3Z4_9BACL|nr:AMP-binding protein [Lysinibacillus yapensis]RHW33424.1 long-chain fatty acid--CoA ligase [Lysinibacillus yapensis]
MSEKVWLSQYPKEIPHSLTYENEPVQSFLTRSFEKFPNKTAIHFLGREVTYKELYESSLKFANYLKRLGVERGDRVAIMLPNCPQSVIAYYGTLYAGGIVVQTNPLYTERELQYQMADSGAKVILALDILYPRIMKVLKATQIENVIITGIKDYLPFPKNLVYPFIQKKQYGFTVKVEHKGLTHLFTEIMHLSEPTPVKQDKIEIEEEIALLQYTGGTTGSPKGVMLTHKNLIANTKMCDAWLYRCKPGEEVILGVLPFFHVYGMTTVLLLSVLNGNKMVLLPKFDVEQTLKTIEKQKPTLFPGAPTMYIGLLNHPDIGKYNLSSITACLSGSAPLPLEVQEKFEKITGGKLVEGYGLTETSPVTHVNFIWDQRVKGSIGVPWPDTEAVILKSTEGEVLAAGEIGEIAIKGPQVMKGYYNRPEETAMSFVDGWFLTGDLGYMDDAGYFYVVDRKKDMIIAGGFNIYPREVEEVLYEHEAVQECVVAGIPDSYRGETVKAYIVLKEGKTATEEELNAHCRQNLAAYKVPRQYEFRKELPKTAVGKILRRSLVEEEKQKLTELQA